MKKTIRMHEMRNVKQNAGEAGGSGEKPVFLLDREEQNRSKILSNTIKQKRAEKAVSTTYCPLFVCVKCLSMCLLIFTGQMASSHS